MPATIDVHGSTKRVLMVVSNPTTSQQTGWPIGFWWAELTHPYWEFTEAGFEVVIASPDGGALAADSFSDPADPSGYSAHDLVSRGFIASPDHARLVENTPALEAVDEASFDAVFLVGGQAPMYTFRHDQRVKDLVGRFVARRRKVTAVVCHATCVLLDATTTRRRARGSRSHLDRLRQLEEAFADEFVGQRIQPFWIEDEAARLLGHELRRPRPLPSMPCATAT
ncbi:MAG: DJ-1/PfpI family protein [Ilumatobacteraceae bacterium]